MLARLKEELKDARNSEELEIKMESVVTVSGFGSRILCINDVAPRENQNGHENRAALICTTRKR